MEYTNIVFTLDGCDITILCSKEEKMKDICQRCATKANININSHLFFYEGKQLDFELSFKEQANSIDNDNNKMSILVFKSENEDSCVINGEKIKLVERKNLMK